MSPDIYSHQLRLSGVICLSYQWTFYTHTHQIVHNGSSEINGFNAQTLVTSAMKTDFRQASEHIFHSISLKTDLFLQHPWELQFLWGLYDVVVFFPAQSELIQTIMKFMRLPFTTVIRWERKVLGKKKKPKERKKEKFNSASSARNDAFGIWA